MVEKNPQLYIASMSKIKRKNKIFIDYFRNSRGQTAIASYSTRARAKATIAMPLRWEDLKANLQFDQFNLKNIRKILKYIKEDPWKGFEPMRRKILYTHDKDGFLVEEFCHVGQWGTHIDPPVHFHKGLRSTEQIDLKEMFLPLVVLDVHQQSENNPDYILSLADVKAWEKKHGDIPQGAFVAMRTDWSKRWPSMEKMQNVDRNGVAHYPGWSQEVLTYLYETRKITASGHETTDTDPGIATTKDDYSLESYILKQNKYQIELLRNLDQLPEAGALAVLSWPKVANGSGFPARVFAILP